jgi:hypothetical protein
MAARLSASFMVLNCQNFGFTNPVNLTLNGAGVATAASYTFTQQQANTGAGGGSGTASPTASPSPTPTNPWARWYRNWWSPWSFVPPGRRGHHQNGTGM